MKSIILVAVALAVVAAAPPPETPKILKSEFDQKPDGSYLFSYETEDGSSRVENGELKDVVDEENKHHEVIVSRGSFSYKDVDDKPVVVSYYADETGYHAEGDSIPKAV